MSEQNHTAQDGTSPGTSISYFHSGWFFAALALVVLYLAISALRFIEGPSVVPLNAWDAFKSAAIHAVLLYYSWRWWSHKGYLPKVISYE